MTVIVSGIATLVANAAIPEEAASLSSTVRRFIGRQIMINPAGDPHSYYMIADSTVDIYAQTPGQTGNSIELVFTVSSRLVSSNASIPIALSFFKNGPELLEPVWQTGFFGGWVCNENRVVRAPVKYTTPYDIFKDVSAVRMDIIPTSDIPVLKCP
jgi:hypothetical protein